MGRILRTTGLLVGLVLAAVAGPNLAAAQSAEPADAELSIAVAPLVVTPNPAYAGEWITIAPDSSSTYFACAGAEIAVTVTNADGTVVASDQQVADSAGAWRTTIEPGSLPPGSYTAQATCDLGAPDQATCTDGSTTSGDCVPCDDGGTTSDACEVCDDSSTAVPGNCSVQTTTLAPVPSAADEGAGLPTLPQFVDYQSTSFVISAAARPIQQGPTFTG
jgi:hypothetical protein